MNLIIDMNVRKGSLASEEFVRPLRSMAQEHEVRHYKESFDPGRYGRVILSGTPLKDNGFMDHLGRFEWVVKYKKPVLGICAGMQALAAVYGSKIERRREIGMTEIETTEHNPLFSGKFKAYELHNHSVKPSEEFDVLAESANCVQAIKLKNKPHYGILFHPEIRNTEIIERFIRL